MASTDSELLDIVEDTLRQRFGSDVVTERTTNDTSGDIFLTVYRTEPNWKKSILFGKPLIDDYNNGSLRA